MITSILIWIVAPSQICPAFARKYSHRRTGIGGDGVITYQEEGTGLSGCEYLTSMDPKPQYY